MISFMVLGGPRSGTTWLANLLTTDTTLCMHDPLLEYTVPHLDTLEIPNMRIGIADTSALLYPDWVASHRSKKVLIWRDPEQFNTSLRALRLPEVKAIDHARRINAVPKSVPVVVFDSLFNWRVVRDLCAHLDVPFNRWRFEELKKMNVQPHFSRLPVGKEAAQDLVKRFAEAIS